MKAIFSITQTAARIRRGLTQLGCITLAALALSGVAQAATFNPNNIVVLRVTNSAALSNVGTAVELVEYTKVPSGGTPTVVQRIGLPQTVSGSNRRLVTSGSATSEGGLFLSPGGIYLTAAGYDAAVGTATIASTVTTAVQRVVARIDSSGVPDTSTVLAYGYSGANIRAAANLNRAQYWTAGDATLINGVRYVNTNGINIQVSTTLSNARRAGIFNKALYVSSGSGAFTGISRIGPMTTTTAATPVLQISASSPYDFYFVGTNVCYVASDSSAALGVRKFTADSAGVWTLAYAINVGSGGARGLIVDNDGGTNVIYAISSDAFPRLLRIRDTGASSTVVTLVTSTTGNAFRGIAFAPKVNTAPRSEAIASILHTTNTAVILAEQYLTDTETPEYGEFVKATSSIPAVLPVANITATKISGANTNWTITLTPAASGTSLVSLVWTDSTDGYVTNQFSFVNAPVANTAPSITQPVLSFSTVEDVAVTSALRVTDAQTPNSITCTITNFSSSLIDVDVVPTSGATNYNVIVTPVPNNNGGPTPVKLVFSDGNGLFTTNDFLVSVLATNDAPSVSTLPFISVTANGNAYTSNFWVTASSPGGGGDEAGQTLTYFITNSSPSSFDVQPTISGMNDTLSFSTISNVTGTVTVLVAVTDNGMPAKSGFTTFIIQLNSVFPANASNPVITPLVTATNLNEDGSLTLALVVADAESQVLVSHVPAAKKSSDAVLLPLGNIVVNNSTVSNFTIQLTPAADLNGTSNIEVVFTDGAGRFATNAIAVTVNAVNDAPSFSVKTNIAVIASGAAISTNGWVTSSSVGGGADEAGQTLTYFVTNNAPAKFSVQPAISSGGVLTFTTISNQTGTVTVQVVAQDNGVPVASSALSSFTIQLNPVPVAPAVQQVYISEIFFNPPGTDTPQEYIELRGTPGATLTNTYLIFLEGTTNTSSPGSGDIQNILNLNGRTLGTNGFLTVLMKGHPAAYTNAAGTVLVNSGSGAGFGNGGTSSVGYSADGAATDIENKPYTAMIINIGLGAAPATTMDLDVGDNGLDALPSGWSILDSVSVVEALGDRAYGQVVFSEVAGFGNIQPGAQLAHVNFSEIEWIGRVGASTGFTTNDWSVGDVGGSAGVYIVNLNPTESYNISGGVNIAGSLGRANATPFMTITSSTNVVLLASTNLVTAYTIFTSAPLNSPAAYSLTGTLPGSLVLNTNIGVISGTVAASSRSTVAVNATNSIGFASTNVTFTVIGATNTVSITPDVATAEENGSADAVLTVSRTGNALALAEELTVFAMVGGSATAGQDYTALTTPVVFPAGSNTVTLVIDPLLYTNTTTNVTVVVTLTADTDAAALGNYVLSTSSVSVVTINAYNPVPNLNGPVVVNALAATNVLEDASVSFGLTVTDAETPSLVSFASESSSDTTLLPLSGVTVTGGPSNFVVTLTPAANLSGSSTVTLVFTDGDGRFVTNTTVLTVTPVNDAPSFAITGSTPVLITNASGAVTITSFAGSFNAGPSESDTILSYAVTNDTSALFTTQPAISTAGTLTFTPVTGATGTVTVGVSVQDNGGILNGGVDSSAFSTFQIVLSKTAGSTNGGTNIVSYAFNSGDFTGDGFPDILVRKGKLIQLLDYTNGVLEAVRTVTVPDVKPALKFLFGNRATNGTIFLFKQRSSYVAVSYAVTNATLQPTAVSLPFKLPKFAGQPRASFDATGDGALDLFTVKGKSAFVVSGPAFTSSNAVTGIIDLNLPKRQQKFPGTVVGGYQIGSTNVVVFQKGKGAPVAFVVSTNFVAASTPFTAPAGKLLALSGQNGVVYDSRAKLIKTLTYSFTNKPSVGTVIGPK